MIDKSAVTAVFEALGPERVARGLLYAHGHTWEDCFLARAYGAAGELVRAIRRHPSRRVPNLLGLALAAADAAKLIGVQWTAVAAVVHAFDHHNHSVPAAGRGVAGGGPRSRAAAPRGGWARGAGDPRVGANAISKAFIPAAVASCSSAAEVTRCKPPDNAQPPTVPGNRRKKP